VRETAPVVFWRFGRAGDTGLPPVDQAGPWLVPEEKRRALAFRVPKRRDDWLTGRLNLKALLADVLEARFHERPRPASLFIDRLPSGAPMVRWTRAGASDAVPGGGPDPGRLPLSVSNSHSQGAALGAALWADALESWGWRAAVGADLEWIEPRSEGFVRDFLTEPERRYCAAGGDERHLHANLVWSAKEAVLKVLQRGLSADTWWLTCLPGADDSGPDAGPPAVRVIAQPEEGRWRPFSVSCDDRLGAAGVEFGGVWRAIDGYVATIAVGIRGA
jgi:phosphopantetheinyl transferase